MRFSKDYEETFELSLIMPIIFSLLIFDAIKWYLKELRNCTLSVIHVWYFFRSIRVRISLHLLPILFEN